MEEKDTETLQLIEKNKPLIEEHPLLVPLWGRTPDTEYDGSYTIKDLIPMGWGQLVTDMCADLEKHIREAGKDVTKVGVYDIKEKYGSLRVEIDGEDVDQECLDIVDAYCEKSLLVCPACGKPTKYVTDGEIVLYLCPECAKRCALPSKPLTEEDIPYYTFYEYDEETKEPTKKYTRAARFDADFRAQWTGTPEGEG